MFNGLLTTVLLDLNLTLACSKLAMCLRNFAESLAIVLRGSRVYAIDYTARESRYEHQDESCYEHQHESRQTPLVYTHVVRINQVDRLSSIIY